MMSSASGRSFSMLAVRFLESRDREERRAMDVTKHKCDTCGKEVEDRYEAVGWIQISNSYESYSISISKGRRPDRQAKTAFETKKNLDFCKLACLTDWFKRLAAKVS